MNSLYRRLAVGFLSVIAITGLVSALIGMRLIDSGIRREAQSQVDVDLHLARQIYEQQLSGIELALRITALRRVGVRQALQQQDRDQLQTSLSSAMEEAGLDLLGVTDPAGAVVFRAGNPQIFGDQVVDNPILERVLTTGEPEVGTLFLSQQALQRELGQRAEQVPIPLISTRHAGATEAGDALRDALAMAAAVPLRDDDGQLLGVLYGAVLLNGNLALVDRIRNSVFHEEERDGPRQCTCTLFQGDVRIATTVQMADGRRALGTRVSEAVQEQVLVQGQRWSGRAFVVNDWYLTAYEPLRDLDGAVLGMLYVGVLESRFDGAKREAFLTLLGVTLAGMGLAFLLAWHLARSISRRVVTLQEGVEQVARGRYDVQVPPEGGDEIATLANSFNQLARVLQQTDGRLRGRIEAADEDLKKAYQELRSKQDQLIQSEKLASLGSLVSGVAHEINNPVQFILGNMNIVREGFEQALPILDEHASHHPGFTLARLPYAFFREQLGVLMGDMARGTERIRDIVLDLKTFARKDEGAMDEAVHLNAVVEAALRLCHNKVKRHHVELALDPALPPVRGSARRLEQVVVAMLINACEALGETRGTIAVATTLSGERAVALHLRDDGPGMDDAVKKRIFDPFFTTRGRTGGTGLGLSVAWGIIEEHRGHIQVLSEPGQGAEFVVVLPSASS